MTAKEARELAAKQMQVLNEEHRKEFDLIMGKINSQIIKDATVSYIFVTSLSAVVKAKLQDKDHQYNVSYSPGDPREPRESGTYKISWNQFD